MSSVFVVAPLLEKLFERRDLTVDEATQAMEAIVTGTLPPASLAAFLTALRAKGESEIEIAAFAAVMRQYAIRISAPEGTLDTCGTGGDRSETFNISTATAFVVAACGVPVAKHGNRSITSKSGSAEVLKALGVNLEASPEKVAACIASIGIGFLFAPALHPGMKHAVPVRRELGIRTVFNLLGPLSNPAGASHQLLGVFAPEYCATFARVLQINGSRSAMVVCGAGPGGKGFLDEISIWGTTQLARLRNDRIEQERFDPKMLGIEVPSADAIIALNPEDSARIIVEMFNGRKGPAREIVCLNAAAALQVCAKAGSWEEGMRQAAQAIDSGAALAKVISLAEASQ